MRRHYLDNLRCFTVVLVVIYHVFYMYNANGVLGGAGSFYESQPWDAVQYALYPWFMIFLFIVSGISSRLYLENHTEKEFMKSRTVKLLVPSTLGVLVFGWFQGYANMSLSGAYENLAGTPKPVVFLITVMSGTGVLWFLHLLWIYCVLLYFIRKFEKGWLYEFAGKLPLIIIVLLGVLLWLSSLVLNTPIILCYKIGVYGMAFFLGYFVFVHQNITDKLSKYYIVFTVLSVMSFGAYIYKYYNMNYADTPVFSSPLSIGFAWLTVLSLFGIFNRFFNKETRFTAFMRKRSFGLYVFHYLGISYSAYVLYNYTKLPVLLIYLITGTSGFAVGYFLNYLISHIPVLRWCVLGLNKGGRR